METLLPIVRAIILIGAVCFAFALLIFGFHVVVREYGMLRTRKQIEDFLRMTNEAGLQADVAKGTISLSRTRPGIMLVGIGAVLLIVCVLQPFQYESSSQQSGAQPVHLPTRAEREAQTAIPSPAAPPAPSATPAETTPPAQSQATAGRATPIVLAYPPPVPSRVPAPRPAGGGVGGERTSEPPKVTVATVEALRLGILDKWLGEVEGLKGRKLGEQAELLRSKYGDAAVGFDSFMLDKPATVRELAVEAYGNAKYEPLLRASNPQLPANDTAVPAYRTVYFLQPLLALAQPGTSSTRTLMRITAGEGKVQLYDWLLGSVEQLLQSEEYRRDPAAWWNERGGTPEFERGLNKSTGRKWATKIYEPEPNESPETVAKIFYGSAKYAPLLAFFNYDRSELFANPKTPFPAGTKLMIVFLSEA